MRIENTQINDTDGPEILLQSFVDNHVTLSSRHTNLHYNLIIEPKDILKLMTWLVGQEKHRQEFQSRTDKDLENQKIVDGLIHMYKFEEDYKSDSHVHTKTHQFFQDRVEYIIKQTTGKDIKDL